MKGLTQNVAADPSPAADSVALIAVPLAALIQNVAVIPSSTVDAVQSTVVGADSVVLSPAPRVLGVSSGVTFCPGDWQKAVGKVEDG